MTEQELRQKVVDTAKSYLGYKESDGSHRKIIDLYNSQKPLPVGYKVTYTDAWCATFVSAVAVKLGLTGIILPECSCTRMIALYQKAGRWMENDAYTPAPGDIIMYDWQDSGAGDNTGAADHVGYVCGVSGNQITVIEGNKNDSVSYRTIQVNGRYIRGYCLPDYASKATVTTSASSATATAPVQGASTEATIWNFLRSKGLSTIAAAGVMGNLYAESGLQPTNLQNSFERRLSMTDAEYTAAVDNGRYGNFVKDGAGYGLAQWTYWTRKQALYDYARTQGKSIGDLTMQLGYLWKELQESAIIRTGLASARTVREASDLILLKFERPADQSVAMQEKRAAYGQTYYKKYSIKEDDDMTTLDQFKELW